MKIVLFIDSLCAGGAQRQLVGLGKLLKENCHDVIIMTYHKDEFYLPFLIDNGIKYCYISNGENKKTRIFHIIKHLRKLSPDVLISYLSTPNIVACIAKCFVGKMKLIVSERNTTQYIGKNERIRFFLYRLADTIVPNSYSQERFIKKNYPQLAKRTVTITNFVDTNYFKPLEENLKNPIYTIISVGRITPQKNILTYLVALKILVEKGYEFQAIWYGNTDNDEYYAKCRSTIDALDLKSYFEFKPATNHIKEEYLKADLFSIPSIYEGFPNVLCEAMCCGLPVVCSDVCDNPLIVEHGKNGLLFNPNKVEKMAVAIESMMSLSLEERNGMRTLNRERAVEMFSEKSFVDKYLQIMQ